MGNKVSFKIQYNKWYLVDLTNYHKPVVVRKHLIDKKQAKIFRDKYYPKFEIIKGKEALKMDLKDFINGKPGHRHRNVSKYEFPEHIKTQLQRKIYRGNRRRAMKQNPPKMTLNIVTDILNGKPIFFMLKKLSKFRGNYWVLSEPVPGYKKVIDKYNDFRTMAVISNISRALMKYYDCGIYRETDVALEVFDYWGDLAFKALNRMNDIPTDIDKVTKEFKARGFIKDPNNGVPFGKSRVATIGLKYKYIYPEPGWHRGDEQKLYKEYIYEMQTRLGIPGFTKADVAGLASRI